MSAPKRGKLVPLIFLLLISAAASSCTVLRAPAGPPSFVQQDVHQGATGELEVKAVPIRKTDDYWELFDDNLPEIGLVAVWVELRNSGRDAIDLSRLRWQLSRGNFVFREASSNEIFERYYKLRKVRMYSLKSDQAAREAMSKMLLKSVLLRPSDTSKGFLLFKANSPQPADWSRGSVLIAQGPQAGAGGRQALELPLDNANP